MTEVVTRRVEPQINGQPEEKRPARRGHSPRRRAGANLSGWGFVAPATAVIVGLSLFPAGWAFLLSFQKWNGFTPAEFVGLDNYVQLFNDAEFWSAVGHTITYTVLFVSASVLGGLFLAVALNRRIRFIGFYRTAIFVPFVASAAAIGILTTYLFNPQYGLVNNILRTLGLPQPGWLEDPSQAMIVIAIMSFWSQAAFTTVIYLAALQDVPNELIEAAAIDGANRWQTFWRVTFPQLTPVTVFVTIWQTISAVQLFDLVYTTTGGGPVGSTETVVFFLYKQAFVNLKFGYGSAAAYVLFAVTLIATIASVLYSRRRTEDAS